MKITDKERLDFLQKQLSGKVVCRESQFGRGWRLHETTRSDGVADVRQAIDIFIKSFKQNATP